MGFSEGHCQNMLKSVSIHMFQEDLISTFVLKSFCEHSSMILSLEEK